MNEKDVKKLIELQGRLIKLRTRIELDVKKYNVLLMEDIRPLTESILHNTIYQVGDMTYKRGRVFSQLDLQEYGLGPKAEGLATLRKVEIKDASSSDEESGPSDSVPE